jgi:hypothetical protein
VRERMNGIMERVFKVEVISQVWESTGLSASVVSYTTSVW